MTYKNIPEIPRIILNSIVIFSIISSLILILLQIIRWSLFEVLTPFIEPFFEIIIYGLFLATLIWSIIYFLRNVKIIGKYALIPILIHVLTVIIVISVPFTNIVVDLNFKVNNSERQKVVSLIEDSDIQTKSSTGSYLIELPREYKHLSSGGQIVIEKNESNVSILFYTYRGVLDNFSGYIYSANGFLREDIFYGDYKQIKKITEHWFWVSSS